jgi:hypothetical protein
MLFFVFFVLTVFRFLARGSVALPPLLRCDDPVGEPASGLGRTYLIGSPAR